MQSVLKVNGLTVKWIFMQYIFILHDYLSENFVRYSFIHCNTEHKNNTSIKDKTIELFGHTAFFKILNLSIKTTLCLL